MVDDAVVGELVGAGLFVVLLALWIWSRSWCVFLAAETVNGEDHEHDERPEYQDSRGVVIDEPFNDWILLNWHTKFDIEV